jgi:hypothetical protein
MLSLSPNELLEAIKVLGMGAPLTDIEKEVIKQRGEKDVKNKRRTRKKTGAKN